MNTHCVVCKNPILPHRNQRETHTTCGRSECIKEWRRRYLLEYHKTKRGQKEQNGMVACMVCGERFEIIQHTHLRSHGLTMMQYMSQYPNVPLMTNRMKETRGAGSTIQSKYLTYNGKESDSRLYEFLAGSLLGDGSLELGLSKKNARYAEGGKNETYLRWKYSVLSEYFPCTLTEKFSSPHTKSGERYHGWWIKTGGHPLFTEWHVQWYEGRKVVPHNHIHHYLTEFALAVWFCDDGHLGRYNACLYTCAFSLDEVEFLACHLKATFGLVGNVRKNHKNQPFLWFCAKEKRHLQEIVAQFQIPGMEYKYSGGK